MALSLDLRRRATDAYERGEGSLHAIAERFAIGHATLSRWIRRRRETGSPKRAPNAGGTPPRITAEHEALIKAWLAQAPSTSQRVLVRRLADETGIAVCQQTLSRAIKRMGWTHKKSRSAPRSSFATT